MTTPVELVIEGRDESGGAFASAGSGLSRIGEIAAGILTSQVFTKLAQGVKDFATSIVTEAREAELGQKQLQAVIESTGGAAGVTADMVNELADKYQYLSAATDDQIIAGETLMLQFTNIGKDIFPAATQAALDLAARTKTDVASAFNVVGKALERPEEGIGRLNQAFKLFSEDELKAVQAMAESGDLAGAQAAILERLADKVGGAAAAQVQPWENVKKKIDNMKESLGTALLPVIDKVGTMMMEALDNPQVQKALEFLANWLGENIPVAVDQALLFIGKLQNLFQSSSGDIQAFVENALGYFSGWWDENGPSIMASAQQIFEGLQSAISEISTTIGPFVSEILGKFSAWFTENGPLITETIALIADRFTTYFLPAIVVVWNTVQPIIKGIVDLILGLVKIVMQVFTGDWAGAWETAKQTAVKVFNALVTAAMNLISGILNIFGTSVPEIAEKLRGGFEKARQGVISAVEGMKSGISAKFTEIKTGIAAKINDIVSAIRAKIQSFRDVGKAIIDGLKAGIQSAWNAFTTYFTGLIKTMIANVLSTLGVQSPSKVFIKIGKALPQGLGVGIGSAFPDAVGAMNRGIGALRQTVENRTTTNSPFYNFGNYNGMRRDNNNDLIDSLRA